MEMLKPIQKDCFQVYMIYIFFSETIHYSKRKKEMCVFIDSDSVETWISERYYEVNASEKLRLKLYRNIICACVLTIGTS